MMRAVGRTDDITTSRRLMGALAGRSEGGRGLPERVGECSHAVSHSSGDMKSRGAELEEGSKRPWCLWTRDWKWDRYLGCCTYLK